VTTSSVSLQTRAKAQLQLLEIEKSRPPGTSSSSLYQKYGRDPVAFCADCFDWKEGEHPVFYQNEILSDLVEHRRESVRGPHGLGKTFTVALAILWFALVNDGEVEWKAPITASAWRQLTKFLMPEVHKWARRIKWSKVGREPFNERTELLQLSLKLKTGEAFALASDNSAMIEGAHADRMFYVFDESKEIMANTWDSAEGAFASGDCYFLSVSTPGEPVGRFYDIQSHKPGYTDWHVRAVTLAEAIRAGRVNQVWADARKEQWGEESAVYQNRVLGEFASSEAEGIIPLSWIEKANARWDIWNDAKPQLPFKTVGVDVARSGEDKTVLALRFANVITELRRYSKQDTMETVGRVKVVLDAHGGKAVVDVIGIGAGVVDRLREMKMEVAPFNASERTDYKDSSGEMGFTNCRSASWWRVRELLDPASGEDLALPPDDLLTGDLAAPHWKMTSGGKIQVESKDDIKERIGRSTDDGDAVVMAFWEEDTPSMQSWIDALTKKNKESEAKTWDY
jgi:hypothetical protein